MKTKKGIFLFALFSLMHLACVHADVEENQIFNHNIASCPGADINWGLNASENSIHICEARRLLKPTTPTPVLVGVVDTGVDAEHPLLKDNIKSFSDLKRGSVLYGLEDDHGHGTHIAGIVESIARAAYFGKRSPVILLPVRYYRAMRSNKDSINDTIRAMRYAINHGVRIINYSGGGAGSSKAELDVLKEAERKGVLVIVAAGNSGEDITKKGQQYYPASYDLKNILAVGGVDEKGSLTDTSNFGKKVDVAAPGFLINSSLPGKNYGTMTGTSQATAFVTGVAALLLAEDPTLSAQQLKDILIKSVSKKEGLLGKIRSGGIVNAEKALSLLKERAQHKAKTLNVEP